MIKPISIYYVMYFTWMIQFIQTKLVSIKSKTMNSEIHLSLISYIIAEMKNNPSCSAEHKHGYSRRIQTKRPACDR